MQSQPYVEVVKVAVYEYATSKCARDAPSRAGGVIMALNFFCSVIRINLRTNKDMLKCRGLKQV